MTLTLLNRAVHDFKHLGAVALNCTATSSQCNERGRLAGQDGVLTAVNAIHEVLDRSRTQTDEAVVLGHCRRCGRRLGTDRALICRQVKCEAEIANLVVLLSHLLEEVDLLVAIFVEGVGTAASCHAVLLLARDGHSCRVFGPASKEVIHLLVKVFLILDRLDAAVLDLNVAIMLHDEATDRTRLLAAFLLHRLNARLPSFPPCVRCIHLVYDGLTGLLQVLEVLRGAK